MADSRSLSVGKIASCKSSQGEEPIIKQTKVTTLIKKPKTCDDAEISALLDYTSVGSASEESYSSESETIGCSGREIIKIRKRGMNLNLNCPGATIYTGSKTDFKVSVRQGNITMLNVDVIVNAANRFLRHNGGVSEAIVLAAGQFLRNECDSFIKSHGRLEVTDVFLSSGGCLKAEFVMHAVGPKWNDYSDKEQCLIALRRTVIRCLVEASRLKKGSIALPSISAAVFKVPKDFCAQCYVDALKSFDEFAENLGVPPVRDILFVDIDECMVNIIQENFITEWHKSVDPRIVEGDLAFAKQHISTQNYAKSGCSTGSSASQNKYPQPSSPVTKQREENSQEQH